MRWTLKRFTMALNNAQRPSVPRSLGSYLREAWLQVPSPAILSMLHQL